MFDDRCWHCATMNPDCADFPEGGNIREIVSMEYMGKGIFKCPRCGYIEDNSEHTFAVTVEVKAKGDYEIIKFDERLEKDILDVKTGYTAANSFEQDVTDEFDDLEPGIHDCEVFWCWTRCCDDWDFSMYLMSSEMRE